MPSPQSQTKTAADALLQSIDRQEMTDTINYSLGPIANTWLQPDRPEYPSVENGIVKYDYDPRRAAQARAHAGAFGLLSTCYAVGSLTGALLSTRRSRRPLQRFLVISAVVFAVLLIISGLMRNYYAFAALLIPTGAAALVFGADTLLAGRGA